MWLYWAAECNENVVQWLASKGIKPPAVDSVVREIENGVNA